MNKRAQHKQKGHHALRFIYLFLAFSFSCFSQEKENTDDYLILNDVVNSFIKTAKKSPVYLSPHSNNDYVIMTINSQQKKALGTEGLEDSWIEIDRDTLIDKIYNSKELNHLLSQKSESKWNFEKIHIDNLYIYDKNQIVNDLHSIIIVGRPIYTKDNNYALVVVGTETWKFIKVYRKQNGKWLGYKGIAHITMQRKAKTK